MNTLFTDAGYDWNSTPTDARLPVVGRICVADGNGFVKVEVVKVGVVPTLRQYNNIFELIAIARAVEIAVEKGWVGMLSINSDSKVAISWATWGKTRPKVETEAHRNALEYLKNARKNYGGEIDFNFVPRHLNVAGVILERELKNDKYL